MPSVYAEWYGFEHPRPDALASWSYGLPELSPPTGRLIANPGCYATAVLLALAPIADAIEPAGVVVDAKSGMTGAGRAPRASSHAGVVLENVTPYRVGEHQHAPEIAAQLGFPVTFVPHLLPGAPRPARDVLRALARRRPARGCSRSTTPTSHVVDVLPEGVVARARARAADGRRRDRRLRGPARPATSIVICALDNLGKGAAGQAVQNVNLLSASTRRRACGSRECSSDVRHRCAGFVASGVHAGIRRSGPDLALVRSTAPAVGAAVWTTNRVLGRTRRRLEAPPRGRASRRRS